MLVTFSCDANENVTMFGDVAHKLLIMMGHSGTVPSAILAADVPNALTRLQQALKYEKKNQPDDGSVKSRDFDEDDLAVSLEHRALPLIELLQNAAKEGCNVMWK